mmetsp:Transcript_42172/g.67795  ORF Transcript_42172/g.67795 Transcript_42172/m.67795 type:complete len:96 (-) Transcript_42172:42-329(-)
MPPSKDCMQFFYDEQKENVLVLWDLPPNAYGWNIRYSIQFSHEQEAQRLDALPLKIPVYSLRTPVQFTITTIIQDEDDEEEVHSEPSESVQLSVV